LERELLTFVKGGGSHTKPTEKKRAKGTLRKNVEEMGEPRWAALQFSKSKKELARLIFQYKKRRGRYSGEGWKNL